MITKINESKGIIQMENESLERGMRFSSVKRLLHSSLKVSRFCVQ